MAISKGRMGIQIGTTASTPESIKIDKDLKLIRDKLKVEFESQFEDLRCVRKLISSNYNFITPCEPDGGLWFYKDRLVVVFEAKKQQDRGNAIERWYKNNYVARLINPQVSYVTFCRGEGATPTGQIGKILDAAHRN
jgi:hypothetical protein